MIMDEKLEFGDALALPTTGPATVLVGDVIDLQVARNLGQTQFYLVIQVDTSITNADDGTVTFYLASDDKAAIAVDGTQSIHATIGPYAKAKTVAGAQFIVPLPLEGDVPYERYLGILCKDLDHAITAGKINAFLTTMPPGWKAMKSAE